MLVVPGGINFPIAIPVLDQSKRPTHLLARGRAKCENTSRDSDKGDRSGCTIASNLSSPMGTRANARRPTGKRSFRSLLLCTDGELIVGCLIIFAVQRSAEHIEGFLRCRTSCKHKTAPGDCKHQCNPTQTQHDPKSWTTLWPCC
jgi:hypothetical protein